MDETDDICWNDLELSLDGDNHDAVKVLQTKLEEKDQALLQIKKKIIAFRPVLQSNKQYKLILEENAIQQEKLKRSHEDVTKKYQASLENIYKLEALIEHYKEEDRKRIKLYNNSLNENGAKDQLIKQLQVLVLENEVKSDAKNIETTLRADEEKQRLERENEKLRKRNRNLQKQLTRLGKNGSGDSIQISEKPQEQTQTFDKFQTLSDKKNDTMEMLFGDGEDPYRSDEICSSVDTGLDSSTMVSDEDSPINSPYNPLSEANVESHPINRETQVYQHFSDTIELNRQADEDKQKYEKEVERLESIIWKHEKEEEKLKEIIRNLQGERHNRCGKSSGNGDGFPNKTPEQMQTLNKFQIQSGNKKNSSTEVLSGVSEACINCPLHCCLKSGDVCRSIDTGLCLSTMISDEGPHNAPPKISAESRSSNKETPVPQNYSTKLTEPRSTKKTSDYSDLSINTMLKEMAMGFPMLTPINPCSTKRLKHYKPKRINSKQKLELKDAFIKTLLKEMNFLKNEIKKKANQEEFEKVRISCEKLNREKEPEKDYSTTNNNKIQVNEISTRSTSEKLSNEKEYKRRDEACVEHATNCENGDVESIHEVFATTSFEWQTHPKAVTHDSPRGKKQVNKRFSPEEDSINGEVVLKGFDETTSELELSIANNFISKLNGVVIETESVAKEKTDTSKPSHNSRRCNGEAEKAIELELNERKCKKKSYCAKFNDVKKQNATEKPLVDTSNTSHYSGYYNGEAIMNERKSKKKCKRSHLNGVTTQAKSKAKKRPLVNTLKTSHNSGHFLRSKVFEENTSVETEDPNREQRKRSKRRKIARLDSDDEVDSVYEKIDSVHEEVDSENENVFLSVLAERMREKNLVEPLQDIQKEKRNQKRAECNNKFPDNVIKKNSKMSKVQILRKQCSYVLRKIARVNLTNKANTITQDSKSNILRNKSESSTTDKHEQSRKEAAKKLKEYNELKQAEQVKKRVLRSSVVECPSFIGTDTEKTLEPGKSQTTKPSVRFLRPRKQAGCSIANGNLLKYPQSFAILKQPSVLINKMTFSDGMKPSLVCNQKAIEMKDIRKGKFKKEQNKKLANQTDVPDPPGTNVIDKSAQFNLDINPIFPRRITNLNYSDLDLFEEPNNNNEEASKVESSLAKKGEASKDESSLAKKVEASKDESSLAKKMDIDPSESLFGRMFLKYALVAPKNSCNLSEARVQTLCSVVDKHVSAVLECDDNRQKLAIMNDAIAKMSIVDPKNFVKGLNAYLLSDDRDKDVMCMMNTPPAPPMTKNEQVILYLLRGLEMKWPEFPLIQKVWSCIEFTLFRLNSAPKVSQVEHLARFYAVLCRYKKALTRLRLFIFNALYCLSYKALPLARQCLLTWRNALPHAKQESANQFIVFSLVYLLHYYKAEMSRHEMDHSQEMRNLLKKNYRFEPAEWNEKLLLDRIKEFIQGSDAKNEMEKKLFTLAVLCFAKRGGVIWTQTHLVSKIMLPILKCNGKRVEVAIGLLSSLLRPYPDSMRLHCLFGFSKLSQLYSETDSQKRKDLLVRALATLRKCNRKEFMDIATTCDITSPSPETERIFKALVREKGLKQWSRNFK